MNKSPSNVRYFFCSFLTFCIVYHLVLSVCGSYSLVLRHTTEEVYDACIEAIEPDRAALTSHLRDQVMIELEEALSRHSWFTGFDSMDNPPVKYSLEQWIKHAKEVDAIVFIAGAF